MRSNLLAALNARVRRFAETGDASAVLDDSALTEVRELLGPTALEPDGLRALPTDALTALALLHLSRYQSLPIGEDQDDLNAALEYLTPLADRAPELMPELLRTLLTIRFREEYGGTGDPAQLNAAISGLRHALAADPGQAGSRSALAFALTRRFYRTNDSADLSEAVQMSREAAAVIQQDDPNFGTTLNTLAYLLKVWFEETGEPDALAEAARIVRDAVTVAPPDSREYPIILDNLTSILGVQYEYTGDAALIEEAVAAARAAVAATPAGDSARGARLNSLGSALYAVSARTGDVAVLEEAVQAVRQAVDVTPDGDRYRPTCLNNLMTVLQALSARTGDGAVLDEAVAAGRAAVAATPAGDSARPVYLRDLARTLLLESQSTGDVAALEQAIQAQQAAADLIGDGQERAGFLSALARLLAAHFERTHNTADLDAAIRHWQAVATMSAASPATRLIAAEQWAEESFRAGAISVALDGYITAMGLLAEVTWAWPMRVSWEKEPRRHADLAADAAACAITAGRSALAIEFLEQARSLSWNQAIGRQPELDRLFRRAPELARRLDRLRAKLAVMVQPSAVAPVSETSSRIRYGIQSDASLVNSEWNALLQQIRSMDGFGDFLKPVPFEQLSSAARNVPVVVLNVSKHGCHALVMDSSSSIRVVNLPDLTLQDSLDQAGKLVGVLVATSGDPKDKSRNRARTILLDVLQWEWETIAHPIVTALGLEERSQPGTMMPHLCWCPTGPLTTLPIHAAGRYSRHSPDLIVESLLDRVVSSYTSTLSALLDGEEDEVPKIRRRIVVALSRAPGYPPLTGITSKLSALERHLPATETDLLVDEEATRVSVLKALTTHSWVHMACHATQHPADPARSAFALWDGMLTVNDLANLRPARQELAFLSSCQTATADVRVTEENKQLAGLMQFLGYRNVISTMWAVPDIPATQFAEHVYSLLAASEEGDIPPTVRAAEAVHYAIQRARSIRPADPFLWAAYVHYGR